LRWRAGTFSGGFFAAFFAADAEGASEMDWRTCTLYSTRIISGADGVGASEMGEWANGRMDEWMGSRYCTEAKARPQKSPQ
jgi:hypothetical protein